ncbi:MAG: DNA-binding response OmpR family regulator [Bradymonadia bacterium]|jgi:DNA-binding response OmpR family regulator
MRYAAPQILVVDSDVAHAASCLMLLEREGFDVTCAHDFGSAWTALKQRLPSAVLTDSVIDGGDAELVLREAIRRSVPTMMMTEIAVGEINERYFRSLGAAEHWEKPLRRADVVGTLRQLLGDEYPDPLADAEPIFAPTAGAHEAAVHVPPVASTVARTASRPESADTPIATTEVQFATTDSAATGAYATAGTADGESVGPAAAARDGGYNSGEATEEPFDWDVDPALAELSREGFADGEDEPEQGNEPTAVTPRPETPVPLAVAAPIERLDDTTAAVSSDFGNMDSLSDTGFEGLRPGSLSGPVVWAGALSADTPPPRAESLYFHVNREANRGRVGEPLLATLLSRAEKLRRTGVLEVVLSDAALSIALTSGDVSGVRVAGEGDLAVKALREDGVLRADQWDALLRARGRSCTLAQVVADGVLGERDALEAAHVGMARALAPVWFATAGDWAWRDGAQDVPQSLAAIPPSLLVWRACRHGIDPQTATDLLSPFRDLKVEIEPTTPRLPLTSDAVAQFALALNAAPNWATLNDVGARLMLWALITGHARLS